MSILANYDWISRKYRRIGKRVCGVDGERKEREKVTILSSRYWLTIF